MKAELNIDLFIKGQPNDLIESTKRARKVLEVLRSAGLRYNAERLAKKVRNGNSIDLAHALVIETDVASLNGIRTLRALAYEIAKSLKQNSIAIYLPTRQYGEIVGPGAESQENFDISEFCRFPDVALPRAA